MRKIRAIVLMVAFAIVLAITFTPFASPPFRIDSCSCSADDGSCSASASCHGGCIALCPSDGCTAYCSGYYNFLDTEVTIQMQNGNNNQLLAELANASGKEIAFSSFKSTMALKQDGPFNLDIKRAALWDVLDILSTRGTVQIAGQDFENLKLLRRSLSSGEKMSLSVQNTPVHTFVNDLANLSGLPIHIIAGNTRAPVNVKLRDVSLKEILIQVSEKTGTKITDEDVNFNAQ